MAKKMNWRADLQKIRNNREKADNAAKRAEEKAKKLAQRQEEAENMGILYVVRSMRLTPEELEDFLAGKPPQDKEKKNRRNSGTMNLLKNKMGMRVLTLALCAALGGSVLAVKAESVAGETVVQEAVQDENMSESRDVDHPAQEAEEPDGQTETGEATEESTAQPTDEPTAEPSNEPTTEPTDEPTAEPTEQPYD